MRVVYGVALGMVFAMNGNPHFHGDAKIRQKNPHPEKLTQRWMKRDCAVASRPVQIQLGGENREDVRGQNDKSDSRRC
jgi:hypothetical protein